MLFSRAMPVALAALVGVTAIGVGGYAPWAILVLELSGLALAGWLVVSVVVQTTDEERETNARLARRGGGLFRKRTTAEVEISSPSSPSGSDDRKQSDTPTGVELVYLLGYPFRRTGVGVLALALTLWMVLSLVPLRASWLSIVSPSALSFRNEAARLLTMDAVAFAPWSVTPFLSFQDVLLWFAYLMIFWITYHVAASSRAVRRLTVSIVLVGIASGACGLVQWLRILSSSLTVGPPAGGFMATGTFGNRNHYAFFQEMMLLVSLGWLLWHWRESSRRVRDRIAGQEARARTALVAVGVAAIALSLVFSLSRSGITFAVTGAAFLVVLSRRGRNESPVRSNAPVWVAFALCVVAAMSWIGIDPILGRFELIPREATLDEKGRAAVWRDSLGAVSDFWLTGSGLSSFQYVYPIYRSFGGRRFYSWAHNDYLQIAVELGLPGLILTALVIVWILRRAYRVRSSLFDQPGLQNLHAGYCAAAAAVGLHSFTDFGMHLPANAALFAVILGVVCGLTHERGRGRRTKSASGRKLRRSPPVPA